jgi:hypothetical protein
MNHASLQSDYPSAETSLRIQGWLERQDEEAESGSLLPPRSRSSGSISDEDQAVFLVSQLYRFYPPGRGFKVEVRAIWPKERGGNRSPQSRVTDILEFPDLYHRAMTLNKQGYGIFIGINPRPPSGKKEQEDIRDIVCLWADVDSKNFAGGKPEARKRIEEFPVEPTIVVDSGNGFHAYWILEEPIIDRTDDDTAAFKQTMVGIARAVGGDVQVRNIDRIFRLPGTLNTKNGNSLKPVRIVSASPERLYSLGDFDDFRDTKFAEPPPVTSMDGVEFQSIAAPVSNQNAAAAAADVAKLKVSPKTKQRILTGELDKEPGKDGTRSGRDFRIICGLVAAGYGYETTKAIFFNKYLPCSDRILSDRARAEQVLRYDFVQAVGFIRKKGASPTPQVRAVMEIKMTAELSAEEKLRRIKEYVVSDLFDQVGAGYKNTAQRKRFVFDRTKKMLMETSGDDFRCFLRVRYELPEKDLVEVLAGISTKIWADGTEIEPYNFARYDDASGVLYISNHDNSVFRLDGENITVVDNGTDGVIFEFKPEYAPVNVKPPFYGLDYFEGGFNWARCRKDSLLARQLLDKTSFAVEEKHDLAPMEQEYLLTVYFYSLFFESVFEEKPILCFTGVKASGKGIVSTAPGKILFGPAFLPSHLPEDLRDFQVALLENYYIVLDNVDSIVRSPVTDALCRAATGERIAKRKLYTDSDELKARPRVFLVITSRDPRFKRDDLVDRLIIFNTKKVANPRSRSFLFKQILDARPALWQEILVNLNSIVQLLRERRDWNPPGIFRIADWELWAKKVHDEAGQAYLTLLLERMNKEKARFGLEDDPLFILLRQLCFDQGVKIEALTGGQLYDRLAGLDDKDFTRRYKTAIGMSKRLNNVLEELRDQGFNIEAVPGRGKTRQYYISALGDRA